MDLSGRRLRRLAEQAHLTAHTPDPVAAWVAARLPCDVVHLDAAACGRPSTAVLDAEVAHLRAEAARGGYVAEAVATERVDDARARLGGLLGLGGPDVALTDGAGAAFAALLAAEPLPRGARVGTVAGEYGGNALVLSRLADERGWTLVPLPVDALGRVVDVPRGLDLVTFPHVLSQRGVVQPVADVLATGVPLVLDVAQSLGQTPVPPGCAAYVGTSRKWLCGPRGVGFLAVAPDHAPALRRPPTLTPHDGVPAFDTHEAHVAGRVGLAVAAREWHPELAERARGLARYAREVLAGRGWRVVEPPSEPSAITTLVGGDPVIARTALLARGLLVSAVPTTRAADLPAPVLRVSTHAWTTPADLDALAAALPRPT